MPTLERVVTSDVMTPSMILIPADLASIAVVRAAIHEALAGSGWDPEEAGRVVLVASEAVANAVEHGSLPGELVEIVYQVSAQAAAVRVLDGGGQQRWQAPSTPVAQPPSAAQRGRGLSLIQALAERVEFLPAGRGTELRLGFARVA